METYSAQIEHYYFLKPPGDQFVKQIIFWIMVILGFLITLSVGMIVINWSLNTQI
ncbi:hypothetical protein JN11_03859 [Mucilaginibacter frigoritolerans]|uniref:Uncharacterized protein n=1 Tax=Mucilaginibacter frigoritolerans TaxID=652788 RepID=A0A562TT46_9SPHI|nr:hypothetical protein [Mucilaginibacter frigoritolerans]TWI96747.1 hypothetical protein JN11_03859 [Mucilaginibacter frigoritolerans]